LKLNLISKKYFPKAIFNQFRISFSESLSKKNNFNVNCSPYTKSTFKTKSNSSLLIKTLGREVCTTPTIPLNILWRVTVVL